MTKKLYLIILSLLLTSIGSFALTPAEILKKASATATSSSGIKGSFTLNIGGKSISGTIASSKDKFAIATPISSSWYNGNVMWTYNPSSKETTLVKPTSAELQETNPLSYLKSYSSEFTPSLSSKRVAGKHLINLVPKSKRNNIKAIEVVIDSKSFKPDSFTITSRDNSKVVLKIKTLKYGVAIPASTFEYPKSKYPGIEIIDLR